MKRIFIIFVAISSIFVQNSFSQSIKVAAELTEEYLPLLEGKSIGVVANPTSCVGKTHLIDTLLAKGIDVKSIFCPEHGFRGQAEAGAAINSEIDSKTGLPIISLYGKNKKPTAEQLKTIDIMVFDIQDVGARFYTYISTLHYVMEAVGESNLHLIVLDRPNPNGFYVDGPILQAEHKSFVGMHPVPIVHGLTIGEYAQMINGEAWLANGITCNLTVIKMQNYTHDSLYHLPIAPSPNLQTPNAIYLYPSICCFEGTNVSVGRGTKTPFEVVGSPTFNCNNNETYTFIPKPIKGVSENPMHNGKQCKGLDLRGKGYNIIKTKQLDLSYLITMYKYGGSSKFFNSFFEKLMGTSELRKQIENGIPENEIRASWQPQLNEYKTTRKKYLLYPDFE